MPSSARAIAHLANTLRASLHVARRAAIGTRPACSPPSVAPKPTGNTIPTGAENRINAACDRSVLRAPSELPSTRLAQRARKISPNIRSGTVGGLRCYTRVYIVGGARRNRAWASQQHAISSQRVWRGSAKPCPVPRTAPSLRLRAAQHAVGATSGQMLELPPAWQERATVPRLLDTTTGRARS